MSAIITEAASSVFFVIIMFSSTSPGVQTFALWPAVSVWRNYFPWIRGQLLTTETNQVFPHPKVAYLITTYVIWQLQGKETIVTVGTRLDLFYCTRLEIVFRFDIFFSCCSQYILLSSSFCFIFYFFLSRRLKRKCVCGKWIIRVSTRILRLLKLSKQKYRHFD